MRKVSLLPPLALLLLAGCGLTDSGNDVTTVARPPEKIDKPAQLPAGWHTETNRIAGFTIGVPPLWTTSQNGSSTVLTSPDKQVAISVSADRTDEALSVPLERFALGAIESLSGFNELKPGKAATYKARYSGEVVNATGTLKTSGVHQRLVLVILRRDNVATYPVLAATNTGHNSPFVKQIDPIIRSLRGRPTEVPG